MEVVVAPAVDGDGEELLERGIPLLEMEAVVSDERLAALQAAVEDLELEEVGVTRHRLLQPLRGEPLSLGCHPVELALGTSRTGRRPARRQPSLDQPWQDGVEVALRRLPEVASGPLDDLQDVVALQRDALGLDCEHGQDGVLGRGERPGPRSNGTTSPHWTRA